MKDTLSTLEKLLKQKGVGDAALDKYHSLGLLSRRVRRVSSFGQAGDAFHSAGREVIKDNNLVPSPRQLFSEMRTDETSAAGNHYFSHLS